MEKINANRITKSDISLEILYTGPENYLDIVVMNPVYNCGSGKKFTDYEITTKVCCFLIVGIKIHVTDQHADFQAKIQCSSKTI